MTANTEQYTLGHYRASEITREHLQARWFAVFGAMIANQVSELRRTTSESPDDETMRRFVEEAEAVANQVDECDSELIRR